MKLLFDASFIINCAQLTHHILLYVQLLQIQSPINKRSTSPLPVTPQMSCFWDISRDNLTQGHLINVNEEELEFFVSYTASSIIDVILHWHNNGYNTIA